MLQLRRPTWVFGGKTSIEKMSVSKIYWNNCQILNLVRMSFIYQKQKLKTRSIYIVKCMYVEANY